MRNLFVLLAVAACSSSPIDFDPSDPAIALTDRGAVRGAREGDVLAWRGIPYAAPPIGELRWRVPQPVSAWDGVRDAVAWGPGCIEISTAGALLSGSEDCLYLNVWAPAARAQQLPVLVFIHGGYNLSGSTAAIIAGERVYDGSYVAAHGPAIVVTLNYRLGALGFFTSPALAAESGASGNYAHHDHLAALRWVRDNIAAFGGDPERVLLFGESAGGSATCALVASPQAAGLFSSALIQSAGCGAKPAELADQLSGELVSGAGCTNAPDVLACLRAQRADAIAVAAKIDLAISRGDRWGTSIDGDVVPESPATAIPAGRHNHMPIAIGTTADEFATLISAFVRTPPTTDAEYGALVAQLYPTGTAAILERYPSTAYASPMLALIALMSDAVMHCPTRRIARVLAGVQSEPVRRYLFAHTYSNGPLARLGAGHALELPFVFGNLALTGFTPSVEERVLADAMIGYWVRFAATGDPSGTTVPWPIYDRALDSTIVFDTPISTVNGVRTELCNFWDRGL